MIGVKKNYLPKTLEEALSLLSREPEARLIAGGTDLLVKARHNRWRDIVFISLCNVMELSGVYQTETGDIHIGPMTTFAKLAENELIKSRLPMLADAALSMGGPQIRNVATIGGNVCNGATSADSAPALFAIDAKLRLTSNKNEREIEISNFYQGPSKVDLLHGEILTDIIIKAVPQGKFGCK
jgi:xanthine dehydrogenase FAD-binding subunit